MRARRVTKSSSALLAAYSGSEEMSLWPNVSTPVGFSSLIGALAASLRVALSTPIPAARPDATRGSTGSASHASPPALIGLRRSNSPWFAAP